MIELCRYIPHAQAERYRAEGWTVVPLDCHHGRWSMLATRYERTWWQALKALWEIARRISRRTPLYKFKRKVVEALYKHVRIEEV